MKTMLLTSQKDAVIGFRLAGIQAQIIDCSADVVPAIKTHIADKTIGIILITDDIADPVYDEVMALKLASNDTMILTIPNPGEPFVDRIGDYIGKSIGIKY